MAYLRETILAEMAESLADVTTANGYETDIDQVVRYPTEQDADVVAYHFEQGTPLAFLLDGEPETVEDEKDQWAVWTLRPIVRVYMPSTVTSPSTELNSAIGDVKKWVKSNRTAWHERVINTRVTQISVLSELTKPHAGFDAFIEVKYETTDTVL